MNTHPLGIAKFRRTGAAPLGLCRDFVDLPGAYAPGYILSPLRGFKRDHSPFTFLTHSSAPMAHQLPVGCSLQRTGPQSKFDSRVMPQKIRRQSRICPTLVYARICRMNFVAW